MKDNASTWKALRRGRNLTTLLSIVQCRLLSIVPSSSRSAAMVMWSYAAPASKIHTQQLCSFIGLCFFDGMGEWACDCGNAFDSIQILVANIEQCRACFQSSQS